MKDHMPYAQISGLAGFTLHELVEQWVHRSWCDYRARIVGRRQAWPRVAVKLSGAILILQNRRLLVPDWLNGYLFNNLVGL